MEGEKLEDIRVGSSYETSCVKGEKGGWVTSKKETQRKVTGGRSRLG